MRKDEGSNKGGRRMGKGCLVKEEGGWEKDWVVRDEDGRRVGCEEGGRKIELCEVAA